MNCEEVMELMQRHLDGDLDHEEFERMTNHLENCPECAEMMQRLKQIDQDLANLPKVTPNFSLVDAILPKLMQIDAAAEPGADGVAPGAEPPIRSGPEAGGLPSGGSAARTAPWYARFKLMQFGGAAAAAVILGVLIVNGLPERGADLINNSAQQESAASGASGGEAMLMSTAEESGAPASKNVGESSAAADSRADAPAAPQQMKEAQDGPRESELAEPNARILAERSAPADEQAPQGNTATANEAGEVKEHDAPVGIAAVEPEEAPDIAQAPPADQGDSLYGITGGMSIMGEPETPGSTADAGAVGMVSEDGVYSATVEQLPDGKLAVTVNEVNGRGNYTSANRWDPSAAVIELRAWQQSTLTYTVKTGETVRTFTIDAANASEKEVKK